MPNGWTAKRERQYEHIRDGLRDRGESEDRAEEVAARTVNKERSRNGETRSGGSDNSRQERTYEELYEEAKRKGIPGRSRMNKVELERAIGR